jgi:hypothetical protein
VVLQSGLFQRPLKQTGPAQEAKPADSPCSQVHSDFTAQDDVEEVIRTFLDTEDGDALHYADLYYTSIQGGPALGDYLEDEEDLSHRQSMPRSPDRSKERGHNQCYWPALPSDLRPIAHLTRPDRPRGPSNFARRVQEKLEAAAQRGTDRGRLQDVDFELPGDSNQQKAAPSTLTASNDEGNDLGTLVIHKELEPPVCSVFQNIRGPTLAKEDLTYSLPPLRISSPSKTPPLSHRGTSRLLPKIPVSSPKNLVDRNTTPTCAQAHPPLPPPTVTNASHASSNRRCGSPNLVKDRIRELEDRQKRLNVS